MSHCVWGRQLTRPSSACNCGRCDSASVPAPLICARPRQPADLAHCECLRFPLPGYRTQWNFRDRDGHAEVVAVRGWLVLSTALALHRAALDGLGPALLADWLIGPDIAAGRLVDLFPKHEATATNFDSVVSLLYASREHVPLRVRAFVEFVKERLP